ncbi:hypothetical protein NQZ68_034996 [Dissostichus eleginoides]|nr:hypothetical protein NQZ68_034996 [Dissostichus eleginoides]
MRRVASGRRRIHCNVIRAISKASEWHEMGGGVVGAQGPRGDAAYRFPERTFSKNKLFLLQRAATMDRSS